MLREKMAKLQKRKCLSERNWLNLVIHETYSLEFYVFLSKFFPRKLYNPPRNIYSHNSFTEPARQSGKPSS